jgi:CrcB protein
MYGVATIAVVANFGIESIFAVHHTDQKPANQGESTSKIERKNKDRGMGASGFVAVGVGAALGAWLRWVLGMLLNSFLPVLPLGTLAANLVGGYLMGLTMGVFALSATLSPEVRLLITTGFLGGLTTFSTFSAEAVTLLARGQYGWATTHILLHVLGSLAMTGLGILTIQLLRG